jgi:hypothetical protein
MQQRETFWKQAQLHIETPSVTTVATAVSPGCSYSGVSNDDWMSNVDCCCLKNIPKRRHVILLIALSYKRKAIG